MKSLLKPLFVLFLSVLAQAIHAQTEGSSFTLTGMGVATPFATDYQCLGINPGNLDVEPRYDQKIAMGMLEGGVSLYSAALTKEELRQNIFREDIKTLSQADQRYYATEFANSANAVRRVVIGQCLGLLPGRFRRVTQAKFGLQGRRVGVDIVNDARQIILTVANEIAG